MQNDDCSSDPAGSNRILTGMGRRNLHLIPDSKQRPSGMVLPYLALAALCVVLASCGSSGSGAGSSSPQSAISSVSVSCNPSSVETGATSQCTATVSGTGNYSSSVTWNASAGTINSSGLFTAPSTAGTVTIKATSAQDSSKSGSTTISVTSQAGVAISPASAQVSVFHSQQFSATLNGSASVAVTWAVNGVTGGNLTVGQIDGTGHYVAPNTVPNPATITISATNQANTAQSASASVTILPDTSTLSIESTSPASGQTGIGLDSTIQIQFNEALAPATVSTANFIVSSGTGAVSSSVAYNPASNTVTIVPGALFSPGAQYSVTVTTGVQDPAGTPLKNSAQWSFTTQTGTNVTGVVSESNPSTLTVVSYDGQESTPDSQGNFDAAVTPVGTSLVAAMVPGKSFGWLATAEDLSQKVNSSALQQVQPLLLTSKQMSSPRAVHITPYQITASPLAGTVTNGVGVDAETTAETLLFMSPYLYRSDPTSAAVVQAAIAADPDTGTLASALQAAAGESDPLSDSTVQADFSAAIISVTKALNSSTALQSLATRVNSMQVITPEAATTQSSLTSSTSQQATIQATPNCWSWSSNHLSTVASGQLPCLDLDYIDLTPQPTPQNGNYTVNLDDHGCQNTFLGVYMGCDIDWLVLSGPLNPAMVPTGGVDAIAPQQDNSGPGSPLGDFLSCASSNSSILSGSCNVALLPGTSTFSAINPVVGFTIIVDSDLGLPADSPPVTSFDVPAGSSTTYAVRAYSGGFGDLDEFNAMWNYQYGNYSPQLWKTALILNMARIVITDNLGTLESSNHGPEVDKCVWQNLTTSGQIVNLENQVAHQQFDTIPDALSAASADINTLSGNYADAAIQCGKDEAITSLWSMFTKTNWLLDAVNTALQGISMIGDATQHLTELVHYASPMETGLVNESQPAQPTIMGVTTGSVNSDGTRLVTISGAGFEAGATVSWQTPADTKQGPDIPSSVSANTISLNKDFGSQAGTWQAQVTNPDGTASGWKSFQVSNQSLLPPPALSSPANGATGVSTTPTFTWTAVSGATNYWLMVAASTSAFPTDPGSQSCPSCIISQEALTATSYAAPSGALSGTQTYYWEVQGYTASGGKVTQEGQYSSAWSFVTASGSNLPAPTLLSPANGATGVSTSPTFSWTAVSGATNYWLMVTASTSAFPTDPGSQSCPSCIISQESLTATSYTAPSGKLSGGQTYYWEVQGYTASGGKVTQEGQYSATWSFVTGSQSLLPAPTLSSPANGATGVATTPAFSWTAVSGATNYWLMVATSTSAFPTDPSSQSCPSCIINQESLTATSYTAPSGVLSAGQTYYWKVQAYAWSGGTVAQEGQYSAAWSFVTASSSNLPAPTLLSPANGATGVPASPGFSWTQVSGNAGYRILVATSSAALPTAASSGTCSSCVIDQTTATNLTSFTASAALSAGTPYYWEVHALTPSSNPGYGNWSSIFSFTVASSGAASVTSVSPNPVPSSNSNQTLTINGSNFVSGATVTYYDPSNTAYPAKAASVANSSQIVDTAFNDASDSGTWKVTVTNPGASASAAFSFTVASSGTTPVTPTNPTPGSLTSPGPTLSSTSVTLSWTGSSGAVAYGVGVRNMNTNTLVVNTTTTSISYAVTLTAGTPYRWDVAACGTSDCSSEVSAYTTALYFQTPSSGPTITSISPATPTSSSTAQTITIYGSNFQSGATVSFTPSVGATFSVSPASVTANSIQVSVTLSPSGSWAVLVKNPDGTASMPFGFTVAAGTASVTSVSPNPVPASNSNQQLTINGSNFASGATVTYYDPSNTAYPAKAASVVSSSQIVDTAFNDASDSGTWKVTVTNAGASASAAFSFTVAAPPAPVVSSISPTTMTADNTNHTLTIYGSNFQTGNIVQFMWGVPPNNGVWNNSNASPAILSATQMTVSMNPGTVTDTIYVRVCRSATQTTSADCSSGTQSVAVTALAPVISSVSPSSYPSSSSNQTMTINGSNFQSGATLTFVPPEGGTIASTATKLTFVSSSQLSYQFNDGSDPGTWKVTVNNPDGQQSNTVSFTVQ